MSLLFQMDLSLKDHIVILDEAHNIEDCARDAGGINITKKLLEEATYDLHKMGEHMITVLGVSQCLTDSWPGLRNWLSKTANPSFLGHPFQERPRYVQITTTNVYLLI